MPVERPPHTRLCDLARQYEVFLFDQYGVLHDGARMYPGVADMLRRLRESGVSTGVVSNSSKRSTQTRRRLVRLGFEEGWFDAVVTSGEMAWLHLTRQSAAGPRTCFVIARDADRSWLEGSGIREVNSADDADLILIAGSEAPRVTVEQYIQRLGRAAERGVPALCINPDRLMVTPEGLFAGAGQIAERYAELGGKVEWIGKPYAGIFEHAAAAVAAAAGRGVEAARTIVVGDSMEHDIAGAHEAGFAAALVLSGIAAGHDSAQAASAGTDAPDAPDYVLADLSW